MTKFENIISTAIKDSVSDLYITGGHPMVSRIQGSIQFHDAVKWSHQEVDDLVRSILIPRYLEVLRIRKSVDVCAVRMRRPPPGQYLCNDAWVEPGHPHSSGTHPDDRRTQSPSLLE